MACFPRFSAPTSFSFFPLSFPVFILKYLFRFLHYNLSWMERLIGFNSPRLLYLIRPAFNIEEFCNMFEVTNLCFEKVLSAGFYGDL